MKRITIFLSAVLLIVALAVPAFAASYNGHDLPAVPSPTDSKPYSFIYQRNSDSVYFYGLSDRPVFAKSDGLGIKLIDGETYTNWNGNLYKHNGTNWTYVQGLSGNGISGVTILWANHDVYNYDTGELFLNGDIPICDGSTCPATDANADGVCDDCGMVLSLRSLSYPALPDVSGNNKQTALVKTKYNGVDAYMYSVFFSDSGYDIAGHAYGTVYQISVVDSASYKQFVTTDGQTWVMIQDGSVNNQDVGSGIIADTTLVDSTFTWYDANGDPFFPLPLWMEMGQLTEGEVGVLTTETLGTMRVLVACGVGLIALLAVLSLFGKRSLISRN